MFSESHCHLGAITPDAIKKAEELGFELLLNAGIDKQSCDTAVELAEKYKIVRACIGIHPWYADDYNIGVYNHLKYLVKKRKVIAISEIGLDYTGRMTKDWKRDEKFIDKKIQEATFRSQIKLAEDAELPVIIHDQAHEQELLDIVEETNAYKIGTAIHGFTKDSKYVDRCINLSIYISVGQKILREPSTDFIEAIKRIPMNLILTETDGGIPENLLPVCEAIAKIKGSTKEKIGYQATENLKKLINK